MPSLTYLAPLFQPLAGGPHPHATAAFVTSLQLFGVNVQVDNPAAMSAPLTMPSQFYGWLQPKQDEMYVVDFAIFRLHSVDEGDLLSLPLLPAVRGWVHVTGTGRLSPRGAAVVRARKSSPSPPSS